MLPARISQQLRIAPFQESRIACMGEMFHQRPGLVTRPGPHQVSPSARLGPIALGRLQIPVHPVTALGFVMQSGLIESDGGDRRLERIGARAITVRPGHNGDIPPADRLAHDENIGQSGIIGVHDPLIGYDHPTRTSKQLLPHADRLLIFGRPVGSTQFFDIPVSHIAVVRTDQPTRAGLAGCDRPLHVHLRIHHRIERVSIGTESQHHHLVRRSIPPRQQMIGRQRRIDPTGIVAFEIFGADDRQPHLLRLVGAVAGRHPDDPCFFTARSLEQHRYAIPFITVFQHRQPAHRPRPGAVTERPAVQLRHDLDTPVRFDLTHRIIRVEVQVVIGPRNGQLAVLGIEQRFVAAVGQRDRHAVRSRERIEKVDRLGPPHKTARCGLTVPARKCIVDRIIPIALQHRIGRKDIPVARFQFKRGGTLVAGDSLRIAHDYPDGSRANRSAFIVEMDIQPDTACIFGHRLGHRITRFDNSRCAESSGPDGSRCHKGIWGILRRKRLDGQPQAGQCQQCSHSISGRGSG